jgi:hypothetical protein
MANARRLTDHSAIVLSTRIIDRVVTCATLRDCDGVTTLQLLVLLT